MDLDILTIDEIRKLDQAGLRETEISIRRELATIRMDIYSPAAAAVGKVRKLRAGLARLLTTKNEALRAKPKAAKAVAAPVAAAPKKAKKVVAAPKAKKVTASAKPVAGKKKA